MKRFVTALTLTFPVFFLPFPGLSAQKRAITFDDYIAMKAVSDPQLSPDGKWVAYTATEYSLKDNRGTARVWLADVATGQTRSEEHTSELQSLAYLVCRLLLEKKKT